MKPPSAVVHGLVLMLALSASSAAQETPVFSSTRDIVAVDVRVVDGQGRPVTGLTPEDFAVTVDGRPRPILSAQFVDLTAEPASEPVATSPYVSTNVGARPGRLVLIVVDQNNLSPGSGRALLASADRLLDRLGPRDRVGLAAIPPPGPIVEMTAEHDQVRQALAKVVGRARRLGSRVGLMEALAYEDRGPEWDGVIERECGDLENPRDKMACVQNVQNEALRIATDYRQRSWASLKTLGGIFDGLAAIEGPKTLLLLSEGLPGDERSAIRELARGAAASRVSLFIVQIEGGRGVDASWARAAPLEAEAQAFLATGILDLARMSGGAVFRAAGGGQGIYDKIARELSGYYLLGFAPEPGEQDGRDHDVNVSVPGRKLTVRWRSSVRLPAAGAASADEAVLASTLRAPFLATDLPVHVSTYALPAKGSSKVRVLVAATIEDARGSLAVGYVLVDEKGRAAATSGGRFEKLEGSAHFTAASDVEAGRYTLKLAALDHSGRRGSVEHAVAASLTIASGIEWGDLVLGPPPDGGRALQPSVGLAAGAAITGRLELCASDPSLLEKTDVALEVSETPDGPALASVPTTTADTQESGRRVAQAVVAAHLLPPGEYVLRASVSLSGKPIGSAIRAFRVPEAMARGGGTTKGISPASMLAVIGRFEPAAMLRPDVAGHFIDRMSALAPEPLPPALRAAADHVRAGEAGKASDDLADAQREDARLDFLRGLGLFASGNWPGALTQFRRAIAQASDFMPATVYLGACYAAVGKDLEAAGAWQTALVSETTSLALYAQLADALLRAREADRAASVLKEALRSWPTDEGLKRRLGIAAAMAGDRAEALRLLSSHVDSQPDDMGALLVMLHLLMDSLSEAPTADNSIARQQFARYAGAYVRARAPNWELVSQWVKYLDRNR